MPEMPQLWWSPAHGLILSEEGLCWSLVKGPLVLDPDDPDLLPEDAVRLMPIESEAS